MKNKFLFIAAMALMMPMMAGGQALKTSYFLDNSFNRNKLNPAFAPNSGYILIPGVGNFNAGVYTNFEAQTFLYPMDGQLYTFLNNNVSLEQFEKALPNNPYIDVAADINLINFGFIKGKSFWTFDMGLKTNVDIDIPRDLFTFMKKGSVSSGFYNIGAVKGNATASLQASLGWSRDFSNLVPGLRFGARLRGIVPVAYAGINFSEVSLTTSPEQWTVKTDGSLYTAVSGLELSGPDGEFSPDMDFTKLRPAGWGISFDLGIEYHIPFKGFFNGITLSAAATDLGWIKYKSDVIRAYKTKESMTWTGVDNALGDGAIDAAIEDIQAQFKEFMKVTEVENDMPLTKSSLPSFYVGAEIPFCYDKMSIGALYSARTSYYSTRHEMTVSYNLKPAKWFDLGVSYSFLNVASSMGLMLELTPRVGPSIYFGFDYIPVEWMKGPDEYGQLISDSLGVDFPYLPTSMRFNCHFGLAFAIGGKRWK